MKIVVGLGNPGARYKDTRHNIGFQVLDELALRWCSENWKRRFEAEVSEHRAGGPVLLVKPQTLGLNVCAFVGIQLSQANQYPTVIEALKGISEVVECHFVTGKYALWLKLYCRDHDHLMEVLIDIIRNIPSVIQTETLISLDQAIERQVWVK